MVVGEQQKTRLWLWQADQERWYGQIFRHRQLEEGLGIWAEEVKGRAVAKEMEKAVSAARHLVWAGEEQAEDRAWMCFHFHQ